MDFVKACKDGDIESAMKLFNKNKLNKGFRKACNHGHLEIAKWLHSLGIDITANNYNSFYQSCTNGYIEIAKWLHMLGADSHIDSEMVFRVIARENLDLDGLTFLLDFYKKPGKRQYNFSFSAITIAKELANKWSI